MPPIGSLFRGLFRGKQSGKKEEVKTTTPSLDGQQRPRAQSPQQNQAAADREALDGEQIKVALAGKTLVPFPGFAIAVPEGSPVCSVCARLTYEELKSDAHIVMIEDQTDNHSLMRKAQKAFRLAAGVTCPHCENHLCWNCVVVVGLGTCPKCQGKVDEDPLHGEFNLHGQYSMEVLDDDQKEQVIRALVNARAGGETGPIAIEITGRQLTTLGWDEVDVYFGQRHAQNFNKLFNEGKLSEATFRSALEMDATAHKRRILTVPGEDGPVNIVAGTAFLEDGGGLDMRVMAEFEDGQVRCVIKSIFGEGIVRLINGEK